MRSDRMIETVIVPFLLLLIAINVVIARYLALPMYRYLAIIGFIGLGAILFLRLSLVAKKAFVDRMPSAIVALVAVAISMAIGLLLWLGRRG